MSYKFLLFDLDHTLFDFDAAEDIALDMLLADEGVKEISAYKNYYIPMNKQLWRDLEAKKLTKQELVDTRFQQLFAHFGHEVDGKYFASRYQYFLSQQGQTYKGAAQLLDDLRQSGYQIYAATNGIAKIQQGRLAHSDIEAYFTKVFISELAGTQKPDPAFFDYMAGQIAYFQKNSSLMIGDSLSADIAGGNRAGLDTLWYNPQRLSNNSSVRPLYEAASYQEIRTLLQVSK